MSWWIQSGNGNEIKFQNSTFKFPWFTWCQLPPGQLTCPVKRDHFKGKVVFQPWWFLRSYISLRGGGMYITLPTLPKDLASSCPFKMAKFAWMETHPKYPKSAIFFWSKNGEISWDCHIQFPPRVAFRQIRRNPKTPQPVVSSLQPQAWGRTSSQWRIEHSIGNEKWQCSG